MHSAPGTCVSVRNNPHRFGTEVGGGGNEYEFMG